MIAVLPRADRMLAVFSMIYLFTKDSVHASMCHSTQEGVPLSISNQAKPGRVSLLIRVAL